MRLALILIAALSLALPACGDAGDECCCSYCNPDESKPCGDSCISLTDNCTLLVGRAEAMVVA